MFKAQKGSQDILKIVHVFKHNVMKLREYFLWAKKMKQKKLFDIIFSSV